MQQHGHCKRSLGKWKKAILRTECTIQPTWAFYIQITGLRNVNSTFSAGKQANSFSESTHPCSRFSELDNRLLNHNTRLFQKAWECIGGILRSVDLRLRNVYESLFFLFQEGKKRISFFKKNWHFQLYIFLFPRIYKTSSALLLGIKLLTAFVQ